MVRYLWYRNGKAFAILVFKTEKGKQLLIDLDRYGGRFDFTRALAFKLYKKYPSRFPPFLVRGRRHPFWRVRNYFEILVLHDVLGLPHEVDLSALPVYDL